MGKLMFISSKIGKFFMCAVGDKNYDLYLPLEAGTQQNVYPLDSFKDSRRKVPIDIETTIAI